MTERLDDPLARLAALRSARGRELLAQVAAGAGESPLHRMRAAMWLRERYPADLVAAAYAQQELREAAAVKFTRAQDMLLTRGGLEQASPEPVARHRARRFAGAGTVADLCCGIGGDLIALAGGGPVLAVDLDPVHLGMAEHNAAVYGVGDRVTTRLGDVRDAPLDGIGAVFADPARRDGGRRLPTGTSEPPLDWCVALTGRVPAVAVKAAPGLDHAAVPPGWELELVAEGRDLKEAVLWSPALATAARRATVLPGPHTLLPAPGDPVPVAPPGRFLHDPNPAVTRAGLVEELARSLGGWKLGERIGFVCTDADVRSPFARTLEVVESAPWVEREFAKRLRALGVGAVDLRRRGLAGNVDEIHRRLKLKGTRRATVVLTRAADRPWGLICAEPGTWAEAVGGAC